MTIKNKREKMSEKFGKREIVIKGGKPWGFSLHNNTESKTAIIVQQIEPGGKADQNGGLKVGDHVIKINDVFCLSLMDALQLIDSAFRTLTILIWRPNYCISNSESINSNNLSSDSSNENKANLCYYKFHSKKHHVSMSNMNENVLSNFIKSSNLSNVHQFPVSNVSKSPVLQKKPILYSNDSVYESNCVLDINDKEATSVKFTQLQDNANLQHISEQYPLSELFLNHETNLKLESLASHSKRVLKASYQKEDTESLQSDCILQGGPPESDEVIFKSEYVCCRYPRCHNEYNSCKMHSPPEREITTTSIPVEKYLHRKSSVICHSGNEVRHQSDPVMTSRLLRKKASESYLVSCKNGIRIKEDGLKNSELKVFKSHMTSVNSKILSQICFEDQMQYEISPDEQTSYFKGKCKKSIALENYLNENKEIKCQSKVNLVSSEQKYKNVVPEISTEHSFIMNDIDQNKFLNFLPNILPKETALEAFPHHMNNNGYSCTGTKQHFIDEKLHFTEKSSQNNNYYIDSLCTSSPDPGLLSSPDNIATEVVPKSFSAPPPLSYSPVKDVVYENIDFIEKEPEEAIYANLEMLKIKCSVIDSATQTSTLLPKSFKVSGLETDQVIKAFSFVRTGIITTGALGNQLKRDNMKTLSQPQLADQLSIPKENFQNSVEKLLYERQVISLPLTSTYFTTSESKAKLLTRYIHDHHDKNVIVNGELNNKKEELVASINKKLSILKLEQVALKEEVKQNDELGSSLVKKLERIAQPHETEKYRLHVEELEKITNLMLSLSGRLARVENALLILPSDASVEEKHNLQVKYSKLNQQYEEAKHLKKSIDRRSCQVSVFLRKYFTREEYIDYDHFIKMKTKLLTDYRELDEKIKLGEEQLAALKSSTNNFKFSGLQHHSGCVQ